MSGEFCPDPEGRAIHYEMRMWLDDAGAKGILDAVASVLEEKAGLNKGKPDGTVASINASVIRHAMTKMV